MNDVEPRLVTTTQTTTSTIDRELVAPPLPAGLDTPCVVVDIDIFERNTASMQAEQNAAGVALRPHLKTAKSIQVARHLLDVGATGITVATLGEAEVFAAAGITDIFVAYPIWAKGPKGARLVDLIPECNLRIGVDSVAGASAIADSLDDSLHERLGLMIEVDSGEARSGVTPAEVALLLDAIATFGLRADGVFTHGGHSYLGGEKVGAAARDEVDVLAEAHSAAQEFGMDIDGATWSAGSSPTARRSNREPVNEERPGSYMFNDRHQAHLGAASPGSHALVVAATVVSKPREGICILDAGAKALAKDKSDFVAGHGLICELPRSVISAIYDHHAVVRLDPTDPMPELGQQVAIIPNHVCPVVNLTNRLHVVRNGVLVDTWLVDARGRH